MATYVKLGNTLIDLDAVTAAIYAPAPANGISTIEVHVGGQVVRLNGRQGADALWAKLNAAGGVEDLTPAPPA